MIEADRLLRPVKIAVPVGEFGPRMGRIVHVDIFAGRIVKIGHHTAGPFPEIGQAEHRFHVALRHFRHAIVQTLEQRLVPAVPGAETRLYAGLERSLFSRSHDPQICNAQCLQPVQFPDQPRPVAISRVGTKIGSVPEIGADKPVGFVIKRQAAAFSFYKIRNSRACRTAASQG